MSEFLLAPAEYFKQVVREGLDDRNIKAPEAVEYYLVRMLEHFLDSRNLFHSNSDGALKKEPQTLAEMYLQAQLEEPYIRHEMLRKTADKALYISGFFGESLNRKIVDVDYYAQIGGAAYSSLSLSAKDEASANVYSIFAKKFMDYVDVLTVISHKSMVQSDQNIISLYDKYLRTGSDLARKRLVEMGLYHLAKDEGKKIRKTGS